MNTNKDNINNCAGDYGFPDDIIYKHVTEKEWKESEFQMRYYLLRSQINIANELAEANRLKRIELVNKHPYLRPRKYLEQLKSESLMDIEQTPEYTYY